MREHYTRHSGKRDGIVQTEKQIGGTLSDQEKINLTGHKTIKMYDQYANGGEFVKESNS